MNFRNFLKKFFENFRKFSGVRGGGRGVPLLDQLIFVQNFNFKTMMNDSLKRSYKISVKNLWQISLK